MFFRRILFTFILWVHFRACTITSYLSKECVNLPPLLLCNSNSVLLEWQNGFCIRSYSLGHVCRFYGESVIWMMKQCCSSLLSRETSQVEVKVMLWFNQRVHYQMPGRSFHLVAAVLMFPSLIVIGYITEMMQAPFRVALFVTSH